MAWKCPRRWNWPTEPVEFTISLQGIGPSIAQLAVGIRGSIPIGQVRFLYLDCGYRLATSGEQKDGGLAGGLKLQSPRHSLSGPRKLVEAAGQFAPHLSMWPGLCLHPITRVRGVLSSRICDRILVLARPEARRAYESLQGSPAVGPLATPRRCHAAAGSFRQ
jgi:hypothetical protein